jgi:hypothetical protein
MAFDFPSSPVLDDEFVDTPSGVTYFWNSYAWVRKPFAASGGGGSTGIEEAPMDSTPYMRRDGAWVPGNLMTADRPILNSIAPATAAASVTTPITVTVTGSKFSVTAKIYFGNKLMPSAFISATQMSFPLIPSEQTVGVHQVTLSNGGLLSQPRAFSIT